ncbi:MAG: hypothetical protein RBR71_12120 [Gudongella sp.]|nr:hypothetical protein [Gudongella sp.]
MNLQLLSSTAWAMGGLTACGFYIIGHLLSRPGDTLSIVEYDLESDEEWAHYIVHYYHDGSHYIMPQSPGAIWRSVLLGIRHPLQMDIRRTYLTRTVRAESWALKSKVNCAYPVSYAYHDTVQAHWGRFGSRTIRKDDVIVSREPRYLWNPWVERYVYLMCECEEADPVRIYEIKDAHRDAIIDAARCRTEITRLRLEAINAKYSGAGELIREMLDLDVEQKALNDQLLRDVQAARQRRVQEDDHGTC